MQTRTLLLALFLFGCAAPAAASETNYNAVADGNSDVTWANCSAAIMFEVCAAAEADTSIAPVASSALTQFAGVGLGLVLAGLLRRRGS